MIRLIKQDPTLFTLWYNLYRRHRGVKIDFFNKHTNLYIDGYPRSGNTFSLHLISNLWPELNFIHHFHAIAPIKIALKSNIPIFILMRDPLNAISSWYLKELTFSKEQFHENNINKQFLKNLARDYLIYYQWVSSHVDKSSIIEFNVLIKYPEKVMMRINKVLPVELKVSDVKLQESVEQAKVKSFGAKDKLGSSLPTKEKEQAKDKLKHELQQLATFKSCEKIYEAIRKEL